MTTFDARTLARGWLSVALASAADDDRPQLDRTISIEAYPEGLRLAATDSVVLLHAWVPNIEHDLDPEPSRYVVLDMPDQERLKLGTYEGGYPNWRTITASFAAVSTQAIALSTVVVARLAKLGRIQPGTLLGFEWAGADKAARFELIESDPRVEGLVMPMRWDFDLNTPRDEATPAPVEVGVPEPVVSDA